MAQISRFFGIIIWMYYDDHNPPHFHACYGKYEVEIRIKTIEILQGELPPRALGLVIEWAALHKKELMNNWEFMHNAMLPQKIAPLK